MLKVLDDSVSPVPAEYVIGLENSTKLRAVVPIVIEPVVFSTQLVLRFVLPLVTRAYAPVAILPVPGVLKSEARVNTQGVAPEPTVVRV